MSNSTAQKLAPIEHFEAHPRREVAQAGGAGLTREGKRTARIKALLPRGITIGQRTDGREKPFFVRYGADRKTVSYATEKERNDYALKLLEGVEAEGSAVMNFDPVEWKKLLVFKQRTGVSLDEAEEIILRVKGNLRLNLTFDEAVVKYAELRKQDEHPVNGHALTHLRRFGQLYGYLPLFAITAEHVRTWLWGPEKDGKRTERLKVKDGRAGKMKAASNQSLLHHRKDLNVFFERALVEKWCIENPCKAVVRPKVGVKTTPTFTPEEVFRLLRANMNFPIVGRLVWELFGCLRCSSVERLVKEDVNLEEKGVTLHGRSYNEDAKKWEQGHKSGKRWFIQGQPAVLWAWVEWSLKQTNEDGEPLCFAEITEKNYDQKKKAAFIRAGWDHVPHNRLRHSAASLLLATTKDRRLVSHLMQHSSWKMLERYDGAATERAGKLVLAMTPDVILAGWDKLLAGQG